MPSAFTREDLRKFKELLGDRPALIRDLEELTRQYKAGVFLDGDVPFVMGDRPPNPNRQLLRDGASVHRAALRMRAAVESFQRNHADVWSYYGAGLWPHLEYYLASIEATFATEHRQKGARRQSVTRPWVNQEVAWLLHQAGVRVTKYVDGGTFAAVLRIVHVAGAGRAVKIQPREICRAVDSMKHRLQREAELADARVLRIVGRIRRRS